MITKRIIGFVLFSLLAMTVLADQYSLTTQEQKQITEEAENWIDDMPEGLQDRLSDAISHASQGFYNEINYFRNAADTIGVGKYKVKVKNLSGGNLGEIPMRLYSSTNSVNTPLLIYFHGGGWNVGSLETTEKFCRALASHGNIKVISVEYPLAPENAYPGALKECIDAVKFIFARYKDWGVEPKKISLGGDGAGGNLALEVFSNLYNDVSIKSLVLYYPMIQTSGELDPMSKRKYGRGYGFDSRLWEAFRNTYNRKNNSYPDYSNLPPTLLISAGRDIIIEQEKNFSYNSNVTYVQFDGALHGFITDGHQKSAFNKAVALTDYFLTN